MSPEAVVLGLASAVRATPLAVVYALLLSGQPRRLLSGYVGAGLAVSLVAGILIITVFDGTAGTRETSTVRYAVDAVLGLAALGYAVVYATGRAGARSPEQRSSLESALPAGFGRRLRHPTVPVAALAGAVTNLPGLFYVAALIAILETSPTTVNGVFQVVVYNLLRFALPLSALLLVVVRPDRTRAVTTRVNDWGRRHRRGLITGVSGIAGLYLGVQGVSGLLA